MNKGWIVWLVLIVIIAVVAYLYTGFKIGGTPRTTISTSTTSIVSQNTTVLTTVTQTYLVNCVQLFLSGVRPYSSSNATCQWGGGKIGVWVYTGFAHNTTLSIVGADGVDYLSGPFNYNETTFFSNVTLPDQNYTVTMAADSLGGSGSAPFVKLNLTTTPPTMVYPYIYNPNFTNGQYTGWEVNGSGFGSSPLGINYANSDSVQCFYGSPWANYGNEYFATTYSCGASVSPGNLTSEPFRVSSKAPFLNFKMISPDDSLIYVEVFQVGGNASITGHFNTYNISLGPNIESTFENVSLPLTTLVNKAVRIKIVALTVQPNRYVAIGGFSLSGLPDTDSGVGVQVNITR